jgi:hypothetical protein
MSNESSVDHYAAVLADLEAQRAKIDAAISTIKALQSGGLMVAVTPGSTSQSSPNHGALEIPVDAFHRLSVSQAIKKYLGMRRKPATTQELVEALIAGGQSGSDGANFNVVVNNTLNRMQAPDGVITKVKRGVWGLKEWYEAKAKNDE